MQLNTQVSGCTRRSAVWVHQPYLQVRWIPLWPLDLQIPWGQHGSGVFTNSLPPHHPTSESEKGHRVVLAEETCPINFKINYSIWIQKERSHCPFIEHLLSARSCLAVSFIYIISDSQKTLLWSVVLFLFFWWRNWCSESISDSPKVISQVMASWGWDPALTNLKAFLLHWSASLCIISTSTHPFQPRTDHLLCARHYLKCCWTHHHKLFCSLLPGKWRVFAQWASVISTLDTDRRSPTLLSQEQAGSFS